jgi:hypothetical protein
MSSFTLSSGYYKITKHPGDVLDYKLNLSTWLGADTIETSVFTADTGITIDSQTNDTTTATVWLSGGSDGVDYKITNTTHTTQGRTEVKIFYVKVRIKDAGV